MKIIVLTLHILCNYTSGKLNTSEKENNSAVCFDRQTLIRINYENKNRWNENEALVLLRGEMSSALVSFHTFASIYVTLE